MKALDVQAVGQELAIKWDDNSETYIPLEKLRRSCPCATCKGEMDIMGQVHKGPAPSLSPESFQLRGLTKVGAYAVQFVWGDGHSTGIYSYDYLAHVSKTV